MKKLILFGAGRRGVKIAQMLDKHGISIAFFCDSVKKGKVFWGGNPQKVNDIISIEDIDEEKYTVIITIADYGQASIVKEKLNRRKIDITTVDQLLISRENKLLQEREAIAEYHLDKMEDYYWDAEDKESMAAFWNNNSIFKNLFKK